MTLNQYRDAIIIIQMLCNVEISHWYVKTESGYIDVARL